jgi:hypothetical protein
LRIADLKKQTNSDREFPTVNCGFEKAGLKSAIRNSTGGQGPLVAHPDTRIAAAD